MQLADYLKAKDLTMSDFAALIGVDRTTVGRWLGPTVDGKVIRPGWKHMAKIVAHTGGMVTPNDFVGCEGVAEPEPPARVA